MKKTCILILTVLFLVSCSNSNSKQGQKIVAIIIPVSVRATESFFNEAKEYLEKKNIKVIYYSAEGNPTKFETVIKSALYNKPDALITFGTELSDIALGNQFKNNIPILIATGITDFNDIKNLKEIGINPPRNFPVALISDLPKENIFNSMVEIVNMLIEGKQKIAGILYNDAEKNSLKLAKLIEAKLDSNNYKVILGNIKNVDDIKKVTNSLLLQSCKIIIIPHDKILLPNANIITKTCYDFKTPIPVFSLDDGVVQNMLVTASVSVSYKELGEMTAEECFKCLEKDIIKNLPIIRPDKAKIYFNLTSLSKIGIIIPDSVKTKAIIYN